MSPRIEIVDYDLRWPRLFQREANRIRSVLGHPALRIEPIGLTSVPGLAAKPTIDTLLVVVDTVDEGAYLPVLEDSGYHLRIREPGHALARNIAKVAMARRLGVRLYWMWRNDWEYSYRVKFGSNAGQLGIRHGVN